MSLHKAAFEYTNKPTPATKNKEFFINVGLVHYDEKSEYNQLPTFQDGSLEQQKCISLLNSGYKITNLTIHSKPG